ncbi:MAG TPA: AAA family ATPase [Dehalococcoidia bacterium]|jgi:hypothetical protein|nr:AAA family ATPase [Dehalococcoidia bacterium]
MSELPRLVQGLLQPSAYPHRPQAVSLGQTQMSFLFFSGAYVYKVKKPVDLGYLDYTTLDRRRHFCHQEVVLNRRLCPEVYLGVVPVVEVGGRFIVEGEGEAVEYAVKMLRLPQERMMDVLLARGQVTPDMVQALAGKLAEFHGRAETNPHIAAFGGLDTINTNVEENFSQTERYIGLAIAEPQFRHLREYNSAFIRDKARLFDARVERGRIRDCHGDLHAAHICFSQGICIYDCIEFNDRFRYSDVASEIAFLAMDMDFHRHSELSRAFVEAYISDCGDLEIWELLDFYKCYRAYVRGKVESFKWDDPYLSAPEKAEALRRARRYFGLAYSYAGGRPQPLLLITAGLVGTGKTRLAQALAERWGLALVSSDVTRKELAGIAPSERRWEDYGTGIYSEEFTRRTYDRILELARSYLEQGQSVIVDASFKRAEARARARSLARELGARFYVLECRADEETIRARLEQRLREGAVSDGRWEIYQEQKHDFDPIAGLPPSEHIVVYTTLPLESILTGVESRLAGLG